uniref:Uncharacterized protein n=1 Tax=Rhizophora mucronata TaxID=61149 RepID=A0A2P2PKB0_RHIMU
MSHVIVLTSELHLSLCSVFMNFKVLWLH